MQAKRPFSLLPRLARDVRGNVLPIVAAAILPLIGMVGSGIDMGRAYVTKSRLQQACDAGVLAARKKLGSNLPPTQAVIGEVRVVGNKFFNLNFENGRYGTKQRMFNMTLENDYAISGSASVKLPTAVMGVFGYNNIDIAVDCASRMNFTNLDIMMVLDVTGSMRHTNSGDTLSRIDSMREVIKNFHSNLELAKAPDTRVRYGFVPYATNVNVGHLLKDDWVADDWDYQSRYKIGVVQSVKYSTFNTNWTYVSGSRSDWVQIDSYPATWYAGTSTEPGVVDGTGSSTSGSYKCEGSEPAYAVDVTDTKEGENVTTVSDPDGTRTEEYMRRHHNGSRYKTERSGDTCVVSRQTDDNFVQTYTKVTKPEYKDNDQFRYEAVSRDVSSWLDTMPGCIEERATVQIADFDNVDLSQARDLDINSLPVKNKPETQWKPHFASTIYSRKIKNNGSGSWSVAPVDSTDDFAKTGTWWMSACPARAQRLAEMDGSALNTYLASLSPFGATYHDIGMIWGGRLLSQNGLFADDNKDVSGNKPTSRHLIFLTDGQTEPYDLAYGAYGVEPLDERRWDESSPLSLAETVEARFKFACQEIKKNNTTVWIIAFGTYANDAMIECAGSGYYFEADDSAELNEAFKAISRAMGDLRVSS
ncbi:pilus assembly protein TadG-related protein [Alteriqipengyuania flavescens]|uniref:TadE/TadG family type IV pilus assembly protein n=1 Tax=Alteriqipengyuania flavescens TaxID=3053610 RepID=UPI0025B33E05|nr:TadE/TadG family type IV pilus assembly protein [Alteriqipengyuania flavescens]WJY18184.1 pilus assembly protein TadG-related protein [Alteriqipengyuania flavescens]WJY24125.1 pilus assembly protein TadG-related protein [Alteriqipengyuania flavescens]